MGMMVKDTGVFFVVTLVEQLDCKKSTSMRCDGFLYFRSKGVERCGAGMHGFQRQSRILVCRVLPLE